jgi:hypothetical protein
LVEDQGILSDIPRSASWSIAQEKLRQGEHLVAVANRPHGRVALLVQSQSDFDHVQTVGGKFYIIDSDLARQAT